MNYIKFEGDKLVDFFDNIPFNIPFVYEFTWWVTLDKVDIVTHALEHKDWQCIAIPFKMLLQVYGLIFFAFLETVLSCFGNIVFCFNANAVTVTLIQYFEIIIDSIFCCAFNLQEVRFPLGFTFSGHNLLSINVGWYQITKIRLAEENGLLYQVRRYRYPNCNVPAVLCCCFRVHKIFILSTIWFKINKLPCR